jgi:putative endonuclease
MYVVYCLVSERSKRIYIGMSRDPQRRLATHNAGHVQATKLHVPYRMIVLRRVPNIEQAHRSEKYFKSGFGRKQVKRRIAEWRENPTRNVEVSLRNPYSGG